MPCAWFCALFARHSCSQAFTVFCWAAAGPAIAAQAIAIKQKTWPIRMLLLPLFRFGRPKASRTAEIEFELVESSTLGFYSRSAGQHQPGSCVPAERAFLI